jgi:4-hydroxybenzoate polyprenyltransferase
MLSAVLVSLRPQQWVKNLFVFGGLIFAQRLFTPSVWPALGAFAIFCGLSGAIYLLNDVADRHKDRLHPEKRHRPIAAGRLTPRVAVAVAAALIVVGLALAVRLSPRFALAALAYVVLLVAYSAWLKHVVIVDVLVVAGGFVLRAVAGALAIDVAISGWLLICTILLALFLALGKRRHEVLTLEESAARHRPILAEYSAGLLDQMVAVVTASTVRALHDVAGDGGQVPHLAAAGHAALRPLRDLSLPLPPLSPPARRQSLGDRRARPRAADQRDFVADHGSRDHLWDWLDGPRA